MPQRDSTEPQRGEVFRVWRRPPHSLPTRLGFFVLGATLCTSLVITAVSLRSIDSFLREKIEETFPAILERTAVDLEAWYEDRKADTRAFAANSILKIHQSDLGSDSNRQAGSRSGTAVSRELERLLATTPEISSLFLLSRSGELVLEVGDEIELSMGMREEIRRTSLSRAGDSGGRTMRAECCAGWPHEPPSRCYAAPADAKNGRPTTA